MLAKEQTTLQKSQICQVVKYVKTTSKESHMSITPGLSNLASGICLLLV